LAKYLLSDLVDRQIYLEGSDAGERYSLGIPDLGSESNKRFELAWFLICRKQADNVKLV